MNIKKTIGMSMIALLVVAMSVSMAAAAADINPCDDSAVIKTLFEDGDDVYVKGQGPADTQCWAYVMDDRGSWNEGDSLAGYKARIAVTINAAGDGFVSQPNLIWDGVNTNPGPYDLVLDTGKDGFYNETADDVENCEVTGLTIVPEFTTIAIPVLALLGLVLYMRRKKD